MELPGLRILRGLLQLAVDSQLDPPDRKQVEPGLGLAGHHLVADPELPSPDARRDRRQGVFHALVDHASPSPFGTFNPRFKPKIVNYN